MLDALLKGLRGAERTGILIGLAPLAFSVGFMVLLVQGLGVEPVRIALMFSVFAWFALIVIGGIPLILLHDFLEWLKAGWVFYAIGWSVLPALFMISDSGLQDWLPDAAWSWVQLMVVAAAAFGGWIFHRLVCMRRGT